MSDTGSSPPDSPQSTPEAPTDGLTERLDFLLEQYLDLLDQYTKLREDLSKTFSAGFFSLAQAQRSSTLGAGRRYGEECYDERMKAQRKIVWEQDEDSEGLRCKIEKMPKQDDSKSQKQPSEQTRTEQSKGEKVDEKSAERVDGIEEKEQPTMTEKPRKDARPKQDPATRDPLTWFGILVPPALRQTQTQFVNAASDQIPSLLWVISRLSSSEEQIWKVREELGISSDYALNDIRDDTKAAESTILKEEVKSPNGVKERNRLSQKSLTTRSAPHSKSQLLKLGD